MDGGVWQRGWLIWSEGFFNIMMGVDMVRYYSDGVSGLGDVGASFHSDDSTNTTSLRWSKSDYILDGTSKPLPTTLYP